MRHIIRFKILTFLVLAVLGCDSSSAQVYNDLNDYGYKGKITSITTKTYERIGQVQNGWGVTDTSNARTLIRSFNEDGNFTKKIVINKGISLLYIYDYSNKTKTGYREIDHNEEVIATGKFTYNGTTGFTETEYGTDGLKEFESVYRLDERQRTKTLEDIGYEYGNRQSGTRPRVNFHIFTTFYDSEDGHLYKLVAEDKLRKTTDNYEFEIIEKDKFNNPVILLVKKNGMPKEIRKSTIEYADQ